MQKGNKVGVSFNRQGFCRHPKKPFISKKSPSDQGRASKVGGLFFWLGLFETYNAVALFPLTAFTEQVYAFETLEDCSVLVAATAGGLKAIVL